MHLVVRASNKASDLVKHAAIISPSGLMDRLIGAPH